MKHAIAVLLSLFVVVLVGIGGWYLLHERQVEAEAAAQAARKEAGTMIPVQIVVKAPVDTPQNQLLYLCGSAPNMGNWEASAGVPLERKPDGTYVGTVELMNGVGYAFKVNRGTWGTVERGADGAEIPNHDFTAESGKPIEVQVASWVDHGNSEPGRITLSGVSVLHNKFPSKYLALPRDVIVYLPPDYDAAEDHRYPVLYMQDGQNLFNEASSFNGIEWKMDETAQRLIQSGTIAPLIIVGVYNSENRNSEYSPPGMKTADKAHPEATGDAYAKFMVEELKPFIDQRYRTSPDRAHTAIGGAAMGGLISVYVAKVSPDVFGSVALFSPWLRSRDSAKKITPELIADSRFLKQTRWYIDVGDSGKGAGYPPNIAEINKADDPAVAPAAIADANELVTALDAAGLVRGKDYTFEEVKGGEFNEAAWQSRVEPMLKSLFPPSTAAPSTQPGAN